MGNNDVVDGFFFAIWDDIWWKSRRVSADSKTSDRCLMICIDTNTSRSLRRKTGRRSCSLPGFDVG